MKRFFHDLFYLPKHEKVTDRSLMKIIISSIVGISFCCLCLVSLTWAWFVDSSNISEGNYIASASFWTEVLIEKIPDSTQGYEPITLADTTNDETLLPLSINLENVYRLRGLEAGEYRITIVPRGTATTFGGYIMLVVDGGEPIYTEQLTIGNEFIFTLNADGTVGQYDFFCAWGSLPKNIEENYIIQNEGVIGEISQPAEPQKPDKETTPTDDQNNSPAEPEEVENVDFEETVEDPDEQTDAPYSEEQPSEEVSDEL